LTTPPLGGAAGCCGRVSFLLLLAAVPATGEKLTTWPVDGSPVYPFLSSVDNAWLATALEVVKNQVPALADEADVVLDTGRVVRARGGGPGGFYDAVNVKHR
jgi:hypothetical protein